MAAKKKSRYSGLSGAAAKRGLSGAAAQRFIYATATKYGWKRRKQAGKG